MIVLGYMFFVQTMGFAKKICLKTGIAGEKKARRTLIHSALLGGTEPLNCGRLISPKVNA
jgi:hypothetical protein